MKHAIVLMLLAGWIATCHAQVAGGVDKEAPAGQLVVRKLLVLANIEDRTKGAMGGKRDDDNAFTNFVGALHDYATGQGISWPAGSSLVYSSMQGALLVCNTRANLDQFQILLNEMNVTPRLVQVDVQFVAYDLADIARMTATGRVSAATLTALWVAGKGELLAAPSVITKAGQEGVTKGVTEFVYPTDFMMMDNHATNWLGSCGPIAEPGGFQTREVGAILQVVSDVSAEGQMINMTMNPQIVTDPVWEDFGPTVQSGLKETHIPAKQPYFHVYSASASPSTKSGKRILIGGGMPSRDGKKTVYVFATATLVDISGEPLKFRDDDVPVAASKR